jgi:quercetin dioxygenase-like cupin family protein
VIVLKVIDLNDAPSEDAVDGIFQGGTVRIKTPIDRRIGADETKVAIVTFPPGARTKMHVHAHEQILYVLSGKGIVATEREEYAAMLGTIFLIHAGEKHWHGATQESSFSHLYIYNSETETTY